MMNPMSFPKNKTRYFTLESEDAQDDKGSESKSKGEFKIIWSELPTWKVEDEEYEP